MQGPGVGERHGRRYAGSGVAACKWQDSRHACADMVGVRRHAWGRSLARGLRSCRCEGSGCTLNVSGGAGRTAGRCTAPCPCHPAVGPVPARPDGCGGLWGAGRGCSCVARRGRGRSLHADTRHGRGRGHHRGRGRSLRGRGHSRRRCGCARGHGLPCCGCGRGGGWPRARARYRARCRGRGHGHGHGRHRQCPRAAPHACASRAPARRAPPRARRCGWVRAAPGPLTATP
eukprot:357736-Chlamydomonas_euryale.AAC.6